MLLLLKSVPVRHTVTPHRGFPFDSQSAVTTYPRGRVGWWLRFCPAPKFCTTVTNTRTRLVYGCQQAICKTDRFDVFFVLRCISRQKYESVRLVSGWQTIHCRIALHSEGLVCQLLIGKKKEKRKGEMAWRQTCIIHPKKGTNFNSFLRTIFKLPKVRNRPKNTQRNNQSMAVWWFDIANDV